MRPLLNAIVSVSGADTGGIYRSLVVGDVKSRNISKFK